MKITITIECDNDAFGNDVFGEAAWVAHDALRRMSRLPKSDLRIILEGRDHDGEGVMDRNGNVVGRIVVTL